MVVEKDSNFYPAGVPALFQRWMTTVDKDGGNTENYLCLQLFCSDVV
jgi:hypothetical protein